MNMFDRRRNWKVGPAIGAALLLFLVALPAPSMAPPAQAQASDDLTRIKQQAKYRKEIRRMLRSDDVDEALAAFGLAIEHKSPSFRRMAPARSHRQQAQRHGDEGDPASFVPEPVFHCFACAACPGDEDSGPALYVTQRLDIHPKLDRNTGAITTNKRYHKGQIVPGGFVFVYTTDRNVVGERARCELRMAAASVSELKGNVTCVLHDRDIRKSGVRRASIPVRIELD